MSQKSIIVLGAGLQGVCVALGLKQKGHRVKLIDQASKALMRTSLMNEGKIHLGLIYAKDPSKITPELMLRSALCFSAVIERLVEKNIDWQRLLSNEFLYLVKNDSMVAVEELLSAYETLQKKYRMLINDDKSLSYFGLTPTELWKERALSGIGDAFNKESCVAAVNTVERAIDTRRFCEILRNKIDDTSEIAKYFGHRVETIQRTSRGFLLEGINGSNSLFKLEADIVVNCFWEGRLELDRQLGYLPERPWVCRLKYGVLGTLPEELRNLPSLNLVVGAYGDIVTYPESETYLSWYPKGMKGWSENTTKIPPSWESVCNGFVSSEEAHTVAKETLAGFQHMLPGIEKSRINSVRAGIVFSWGNTDILDPDSELHRRYETGIHAYDGYFSIDTGKFTCAPFYADQLLSQFF